MTARRASRGRGASGDPVHEASAPTATLVDTCAWIDFFRAGERPLGRALNRILKSERVVTCGQVLFELLQGVRSEADRVTVMAALGSLEYAEVGPRVWMRAAAEAATLRRRGRKVPGSDLLIAALALEHGFSLLTADRHFEEIPGVILAPWR